MNVDPNVSVVSLLVAQSYVQDVKPKSILLCPSFLVHFAAIVIIYNMMAVILSKQIHAVNDSHGYTVSQSIYLHYSLHYKTME